jgi:hypothetical protein
MALNMTIKSTVGLILGITILFFVFNVGGVIFGFLFPDVSQLTEESLDGINDIVNDMVIGENSTFLFYMNNGYYFVGFDKGDNTKSGIFERPASCFGKSCLVICDDDNSPDSCKNSKFVKVFEFDKIVTTSNSGIITVVQGKYVNLDIKIVNGSLIVQEK